MKAIIISIKPEWVAKILNGEKSIEIRKNMPKSDLPIDVYIYCTKTHYHGFISNKYIGKVVAKFTLNKLTPTYNFYEEELCALACISKSELSNYLGNDDGMAWHVENLEIFKTPKELKQFCVYSHTVSGIDINGKHTTYDILKPLTKAPQSWCYIEV